MDHFTMFSYDLNHDPTVVANVTIEQAKAFAEAKDLTGFFLAPHWSQYPNSGGMRSYRWNEEKGKHRVWTVRGWVFTNLLDPKRTETGLDDKPVEASSA
jgi:hypothetical protein